MLERPSAPVSLVDQNLDGPNDLLSLHEISTLLIQQDNLDALYKSIVEAAIAVMSSDMASIQSFDAERNELQLLAWKGFHPESATFWKTVHFSSASTCGVALSSGARAVVSDVDTCDFMAGTADLDEYRRSNIRAVQSTPLVSRSGQLLGMISTHRREPGKPAERDLWRLDVLARQAADLVQGRKAEEALRESNNKLLFLASIVESSDVPIMTKNLDGIITSWNKAAERVFSYTAEEAIGKPITILIPVERHDEEPAILERIRRGERIDHYETIRQRKDGSLMNVSLTVSPVRNAQGEIIGASKIARDITERKRNEERITTLAQEAEHRTKNILATVQATVKLSQSDTVDGLKGAIEGRIQALANVHDLFVNSRWTGAELYSIAAQELAPYVGKIGARAQLDGPHVLLGPNTAQMIAVALDELATNAAKYGALSVAKGRVEVKWSLVANDQLILTWKEKGGPPVKKPARRGFGTRVMERMIRGQNKGDLRLYWRAEGLTCVIILPV
jgi:PAS domain S-box-containing protein